MKLNSASKLVLYVAIAGVSAGLVYPDIVVDCFDILKTKDKAGKQVICGGHSITNALTGTASDCIAIFTCDSYDVESYFLGATWTNITTATIHPFCPGTRWCHGSNGSTNWQSAGSETGFADNNTSCDILTGNGACPWAKKK